MHVAPMLLSDWLQVRSLTDAAFAAVTGCGPTTVNRIRRGATMPEASLIARIVAATDGQVTANDLFDAYQAAHADPAPPAKDAA